MKKFSSLIRESKITVDDINEFFLDFINDKYALSDLVKFEKVEISSFYSKVDEICVLYKIDNKFYSIDDSKIDLFIQFLSCVKENCNRWGLDYKIILGHDRKLVISKDIPESINRYSKRRGDLLGYGCWSGSLRFSFGDDTTIRFMTLISVDNSLDFSIKLRSDGASEWSEKRKIQRVLGDKEGSISAIREHFKFYGLDGDISMEGLNDNGYDTIIFTLKVKE